MKKIVKYAIGWIMLTLVVSLIYWARIKLVAYPLIFRNDFVAKNFAEALKQSALACLAITIGLYISLEHGASRRG